MLILYQLYIGRQLFHEKSIRTINTQVDHMLSLGIPIISFIIMITNVLFLAYDINISVYSQVYNQINTIAKVFLCMLMCYEKFVRTCIYLYVRAMFQASRRKKLDKVSAQTRPLYLHAEYWGQETGG